MLKSLLLGAGPGGLMLIPAGRTETMTQGGGPAQDYYLNYWGYKQYSSGRRYYESLGGEGTELQWDQLIGYSPDWVEIVTWNDFEESTYVSPVVNPGQYFSEFLSPRRNTHAGARGQGVRDRRRAAPGRPAVARASRPPSFP